MGDSLALRGAAFLDRVSGVAETVARALPVLDLQTPEHEQRAGLLLRAIATLRKEGDSLRKEEKRPALEAGRAVDAKYGAPDKILAEAEAQLRAKIGQAKERREAARRAEIEAAAAAARAGDAQEANAAVVRAAEIAPAEIEGVAEVWTYEAIAFDIRSMPLAYLAVDMPKVRAEIAAAVREDREPSIPGVAFERRARLRVGRL